MLRTMGIWVWALALGAGCLEASTIECAGTVCPSSLACDEVHGACVRPEQLTRCTDQPDGVLCQVAGSDGFHCDQGVCVLGVCGDGIDDANEACDDGPDNSATEPDACRTTCQAAGCGDGVIDAGEACDDGEDNSSTEPDACRDNCTLPRCGDLVEDTGEVCDDGNTSGGDGCSPTCLSDEICGNGLVEFTVDELCDDGNNDPGDGCGASCQIEGGWDCNGEPTVCAPACGDGARVGEEACDDANLTSGDGCDAACLIEMGWTCDSTPSLCDEVCGDSLVVGDELCDEGDIVPGDGCSANCLLEFCGNGDLDGAELCDDGNNVAGDGCAPDCLSDETCGNGVIDFSEGEQCDDGDEDADDGCGATCLTESGWNCVGQPSACTSNCGDGAVVGSEGCDDANVSADDGCSPTCQVDTGWVCGGVPSACAAVCGDFLVNGPERCDDGNLTNGDGCTADCDREPVPDRILAIVDSSGSMHGNACDATFTGGDGSVDCPGSDVSPVTCNVSTSGNGIPDDSRLYFVKEALKNVILSGGGATEWALMRFQQVDTGAPFACPTSNSSEPSGGWQGAGAAPCTGLDAGELLVDWNTSSSTGNFDEIVSWMDHTSDHPTNPSAVDVELRGTGTTPLAGALASAKTHLDGVRATDPFAACRQYKVVLVTDGDETCGGDPVSAAADLVVSGVPVHVISVVVNTLNHDEIAVAGGTSQAIVAIGGDDLFGALLDLAETQPEDELCNSADDDCDGAIDEDFFEAGLGETCDNGLLGQCQQSGLNVCSPDTTGLSCTAPADIPPTQEVCNDRDEDCDGVADDGIVPVCGTCPMAPTVEECNALDDDCDGHVDEYVSGDMVQIGSFWIDRYEASRPDATPTSIGTTEWTACSEVARLPWIGATHEEAAAACAAWDKRLCTEDEWQQACGGALGLRYPYGDVFDADACNGREYDPDCTGTDQSYALPTGELYGCPSPTATCSSDYGVIDMSGNLAEWTATPAGDKYKVRGGSYNATAGGLRCDFDLVALSPETSHGDLGFRCCKD